MNTTVVLRSLLPLILLSLAAPAIAVYKCENGDKITYSDTLCPGGKQLDLASMPSADTAAQRQILREKAEVKRLENKRHKQEATEEKARRKAARAHAAKQKKCAGLDRRRKWATEDAASATRKTRKRAERKARRADEVYRAECDD